MNEKVLHSKMKCIEPEFTIGEFQGRSRKFEYIKEVEQDLHGLLFCPDL